MVSLFTPDTIEFVQGEKGETYPIFLFDKDGVAAVLTPYSAATLTILSAVDNSVLAGPITLTINTGNSSVEWAMLAADTDIPDTEADKEHIGIIELTTGSIIRRVHPNPVVKVFKNKVVSFP